MLRKLFALAVFALALASTASATFTGKIVSVTQTAQTVTFGGTDFARVSVSMVSDGSDDAVFRIYACGETVVAVAYADRTTNAITIKSGEHWGTDHNPRTQSGRAWCAMSIIADTGDTASIRLAYE
jgi:hypothetical protein